MVVLLKLMKKLISKEKNCMHFFLNPLLPKLTMKTSSPPIDFDFHDHVRSLFLLSNLLF